MEGIDSGVKSRQPSMQKPLEQSSWLLFGTADIFQFARYLPPGLKNGYRKGAALGAKLITYIMGHGNSASHTTKRSTVTVYGTASITKCPHIKALSSNNCRLNIDPICPTSIIKNTELKVTYNY